MPRETYKKKITSEELLSQVDTNNGKLMQRFLREKGTRCSTLTIKNYQSDLNIFFVWNLQNNDNKSFIETRKIEFSDFFAYAVEELRWGSSRFARMKSTLSSFSDFIEKYYDEEYPNFRNVILRAIESMPKNVAREKTVLTKEQVEGVLKHLSSKRMHQEACWFALAVASGSRFAELLRFTSDVIDVDNVVFDGIFIETSRPIKSKGRTKSGKLVTKYIIKDIFLPYYEMWMKKRTSLLKKKDEQHESLFVKKNGKPAGEHTVRIWVKYIEEFLGVPFYPHCLRHYTTTYLAQVGLPYNLIKEIFNWESIEMVSVYDDTEAKDKDWAELKVLKKDLGN